MASNRPCTLITCTNDGDLVSYFGAYSLNGTLHYANTILIVPLPNGTGATITIPAGSITFSIPPQASSFSYQGCLSTITLQIPTGATTAQLAALAAQMVQMVAQQTAQCAANTKGPGFVTPGLVGNDSINVGCSDGSQLTVCTAPTWPRGLSFNSAGVGFVNCQINMFKATTKAQANAQAAAYVTSFIAAEISSGNFVCGGPCPASPCQQMLDDAEWDLLPPAPPAQGSISRVGAVVTFNAFVVNGPQVSVPNVSISFTNNTNSDCNYSATLSDLAFAVAQTNCGNVPHASCGVDANDSLGNFFSLLDVEGPCSGGTTDGPYVYNFTVPAMSTYSTQITFFAEAANTGSASVSGTLTVAVVP